MPEWEKVPLESLLGSTISYGIVQPGSGQVGGIPIVRVKDVRKGKVDTQDPLCVSPEVESKYARTRLCGGEILVTLVGSTGQVAVASHELAGWNVARAIGVLRPISTISPRWLQYFLESDSAQQYIREHLNTTVQATLNLKDLRLLPVALPSRGQREAVVSVLGALDDKIAVNERIVSTSVDLADAQFAREVSGLGLSEETFGSVALVAGGGTPNTKADEYWGGDLCWATPTDVTALSSPYLFGTSRTITELGLENCASQLYPAQSIFMTSRATIGAFALPQVPTAVNQGFIVVLPPSEEMRWWLLHEMRSRVDEMISLANGSTFLELSRKNFKTMRVRLPHTTQSSAFAQNVAPLHAAAAHAVRENRTLATLRDTLLPQLMSGRLRVKDAEKMVEDAT